MVDVDYMAYRRSRIADDTRTRRRTLRQTERDMRRGVDLITPSSSPDEIDNVPQRPKTRAATNAERARQEAAERLKEWKKKKEILAKELRKARPPFNNHVRVKHTGLSPYQSTQSRAIHSKPLPFRANAPTRTGLRRIASPPPATSRTLGPKVGNTATKPSAAKPVAKPTKTQPAPLRAFDYPTGVVNFGLPPHLMVKKTFKPPSNIRPIPLVAVKAEAKTVKAAPKISPPSTAVKNSAKNPPPPAVAATATRVAPGTTGVLRRALRTIQPPSAVPINSKIAKPVLKKVAPVQPFKPTMLHRSVRLASKIRSN